MVLAHGIIINAIYKLILELLELSLVQPFGVSNADKHYLQVNIGVVFSALGVTIKLVICLNLFE